MSPKPKHGTWKNTKAFHTSSDARESDQAPGHYFAVASVNVGLPTSAFKGLHGQYRLGRIEQLVEKAMSNPDVLGIAFCEVGDSFKGLDEKDEHSFESTVRSGVSYSRIVSDPNILFAPCSSCVIALRGDVVICDHGVFENLTSGDPCRNAQWVDIMCPDATAMRLVNSHQPSSKLNPSPWKYRHDVCTGILRRAEHKFLFLSVS